MTRVLRDPRWLGGLTVAVVFAVTCVLLAQWQLDRRVTKAERNAAVLENYDAPPVPLDAALDRFGGAGTGRSPGPEEQWTPVRLVGRYDTEATVLVRNRPQGGSNGYQVAVPFETAGPERVRLLLVRGWVPSGTGADAPSAVPAPPGGTVEVVARLRSGESPATRAAPPGQTYRLDLPTLLGDDRGAAAAGTDVYTGAFGVVATEDGAPPAGLPTLERPDTDPGPHLAYGVQWYLFALAGLGIWGVLAWRHASDSATDGTSAPRGGRGAREDWVYDPGR